MQRLKVNFFKVQKLKINILKFRENKNKLLWKLREKNIFKLFFNITQSNPSKSPNDSPNLDGKNSINDKNKLMKNE
jgi:hypothetical protein